MNKSLLSVFALFIFFGGFVWAADLQDTQCDKDESRYREMPPVKKALAAEDRKDIDAAIKFYKIAVDENNPKVQLGAIYKDNPRDVAQALRLIKSAAEQDYGMGQTFMGHFYNQGIGVAQNYVEAVRWFKLGAAKGCDTAWWSLSKMYQDGKGTPRNYVKAHLWINLYAAKYGGKSREEERDRLEEMMTPQQISQAQQLATRCQAQNFKNCD